MNGKLLSEQKLTKVIEDGFKNIPTDRKPVVEIKRLFKFLLPQLIIEFTVNRSDATKKNRIAMSHYLAASRKLINAFINADVPDNAKLSVEQWENVRDECMKEISETSADPKDQKRKNTASVRSALDVDVAEHNRLKRSKSGIILPRSMN